MNTTDFHAQAGERAQWHDFAGVDLPFLSCADVGVFKAFFDRTKDWADLEEMQAAGTLDLDRVIGVLVRYLGPDDDRVEPAAPPRLSRSASGCARWGGDRRSPGCR